jgi:hypothetical protein
MIAAHRACGFGSLFRHIAPFAVLWVFAARVIPPKPESQVVATKKHKKLNYVLLILVFVLLCG